MRLDERDERANRLSDDIVSPREEFLVRPWERERAPPLTRDGLSEGLCDAGVPLVIYDPLIFRF